MIKYGIASLFSDYSYLFVKTDFVLRIGRLSKRHKKAWRNYFPPPGYGIPPGRSLNRSDDKVSHHRYSLFLWPGQLSVRLWVYIIFVFPVALLPLLNAATLANINLTRKNYFFDQNLLHPNFTLILFFCLIGAFFYLPESIRFVKGLYQKTITIIENVSLLISIRWKHWGKTLLVLSFSIFFLYQLTSSLLDLKAVALLIKNNNPASLFLLAWGFISLVAIIILRAVFNTIPPSLSQTWNKWPESQYDLFLTVPHKINLSLKDRVKTKRDKYWSPDASTPASQQSLHYAKNRHSLQEVILDLAIFDFLFRKKTDIDLKDDRDETQPQYKHSVYSSVRLENWFLYFLSPVWISYLLLLLMMVSAQLLFSNDVNQQSHIPLLFNYPNSFAWAAIIWFFISYRFIRSRIKHLEILYSRVYNGYYHSHLELVPQQILDNISQIPTHNQLKEAIESMKKLLSYILVGALPSFLLLLEIFSNGLKV